jgi:hypothetical protein
LRFSDIKCIVYHLRSSLLINFIIKELCKEIEEAEAEAEEILRPQKLYPGYSDMGLHRRD